MLSFVTCVPSNIWTKSTQAWVRNDAKVTVGTCDASEQLSSQRQSRPSCRPLVSFKVGTHPDTPYCVGLIENSPASTSDTGAAQASWARVRPSITECVAASTRAASPVRIMAAIARSGAPEPPHVTLHGRFYQVLIYGAWYILRCR
jgi:hypothetical protein